MRPRGPGFKVPTRSSKDATRSHTEAVHQSKETQQLEQQRQQVGCRRRFTDHLVEPEPSTCGHFNKFIQLEVNESVFFACLETVFKVVSRIFHAFVTLHALSPVGHRRYQNIL